MTSSNAHLAEIRELEAALAQSLLALDYAQQQREPVFVPAAKVAAIQQRLDQLRGRQVAEHPARRAAWLAHLAKSGLAVRDEPSK